LEALPEKIDRGSVDLLNADRKRPVVVDQLEITVGVPTLTSSTERPALR
jgi:hypothetical protein